MRHVVLVAAVSAAVVVAGCVTSSDIDPPAGQKAKISREAMAYFTDSYQPTIGTTHPGAFAVSKSGYAAFYTYCEDVVCMSGVSYGQRAIKGCERNGEPCYLFAIGRDIRVDYEIVN